MRFHYVASSVDGRVVEGDIEKQGPGDVLEWMASQGLRPVSVGSVGGVEVKGVKAIFSSPINVADKVFLTKYLALMLNVGTDLFKAIDILIADFDKPAVKALLIEIRDALSKGQPFYGTFTKYPKYFSPVFVNLIKAGEASGTLDKAFNDLSKSLEKEQALRSKIKGALVYPIVLVALAFAILFLLVTFALPKIAGVFLSAGGEVPTFSRVVFGIGLFFGKYVYVITPSLAILGIALWYFGSKTLVGKSMVSNIVNHIPIVNNVTYKIALQRFAYTFSSLLRSGVPILSALEITAEVAGSVPMKTALIRISREGISKGLTVGEAFRREPVFPRVVVNLIAVSEKTGHIEGILDTLAEFYESEIDSATKTLVSFLEPALLIVIGLVVGLIALSIIIPVYQLVGQIS